LAFIQAASLFIQPRPPAGYLLLLDFLFAALLFIFSPVFRLTDGTQKNWSAVRRLYYSI